MIDLIAMIHNYQYVKWIASFSNIINMGVLLEDFRFGISNVKIDDIIVINALNTDCKRFIWMKCKCDQSSNGLCATILKSSINSKFE